MNISVFTPNHDSRYLSDCYRSLVSQSYTDREWVVVLNLGAAVVEDVTMVDPEKPVLGYPDNSVGVIKLIDFLQRISDRAALLNECYRVLCHGGLIITQSPSTAGRGAFQDPSHLSFWNENSFWYLTRAELRFAIRTLNCRLQISRLHTGYPTAWHQEQMIPYVYANLIAIKDGPRQVTPCWLED